MQANVYDKYATAAVRSRPTFSPSFFPSPSLPVKCHQGSAHSMPILLPAGGGELMFEELQFTVNNSHQLGTRTYRRPSV